MSDTSAWSSLDVVLDELLTLPASERRAALAARTDLSPEVRRRVEAILLEDDDRSFLGMDSIGGRPIVQDLVDSGAGNALAVGSQFAAYEIVELAGRGGMGEVYRARDPRLGRDVALKVIPADLAGDPERAARFDREARVLGALNHPNIGAIYGVVEDGGRRALVLEFVDGPTLAARIADGLEPPEIVGIARQIAVALEAAHHRGIVHRDLKPSNIKVIADGTVKVLDFGLARALSHAGVEAVVTLTTQWHPHGRILGTPAYMSPEQVLGETVTERSDIWTFGCVLYEMLTGARAFPGDSTQEVLGRVLAHTPDAARIPASAPAALRRLVQRALVREPQQRLSSIAEALREIDDAARAMQAPSWRRAFGVLTSYLRRT